MSSLSRPLSPSVSRSFRARLRACLAGAAMLLLAACAAKAPVAPTPPPPTSAAPGFTRVGPAEALALADRLDPATQRLGSWNDMAGALSQSLAYLDAKPSSGLALDTPGLQLTWGQLDMTARRLLADLPRLDADPSILARDYVWLRVGPDPLLTGYYAPLLDASLTKKPGYDWPLYGLPHDLQSIDLGQFQPRWTGQKIVYRVENGRIKPYYDRRQIDLGKALAGRHLEIAWTRDPWDIYVLQVQGSGYLKLPDGRVQPVLYAGKNGRQFISSEKLMLQRGLLDRAEIDREGIRAALDRLGPEKIDILAENPSYVFFRLSDSPPVGTIGRPLTGLVSMATDPGLLPLGSIIPFSADLPGGSADAPWTSVHGIGLAQDTGGLIKGSHIDYYCGAGQDREWMAFHMKKPAQAFLLLHRDALALAPGGAQ